MSQVLAQLKGSVMSVQSPQSAIFALADEIVDRLAESDPLFATEQGIPGYDHLLPDFSVAKRRRDQAQIVRDLQILVGQLQQLCDQQQEEHDWEQLEDQQRGGIKRARHG